MQTGQHLDQNTNKQKQDPLQQHQQQPADPNQKEMQTQTLDDDLTVEVVPHPNSNKQDPLPANQQQQQQQQLQQPPLKQPIILDKDSRQSDNNNQVEGSDNTSNFDNYFNDADQEKHQHLTEIEKQDDEENFRSIDSIQHQGQLRMHTQNKQSKKHQSNQQSYSQNYQQQQQIFQQLHQQMEEQLEIQEQQFKKRIQAREEEMQRTITTLRNSNYKLRAEIKDLTEKLNQQIEKQAQQKQQKKPEKNILNSPEQITQSKDSMQLELECAYKKLDYYKKEMRKLQQQSQERDTINRVMELENQILLKDKIIENINQEQKTLQKINREQQKVIDNFQNNTQYQQKIQDLAKQVDTQKLVIQQLKQKETQQEKVLLKKQEYISNLEKRHREVCEQLGISANSNKPLQQEIEMVKQKANSELFEQSTRFSNKKVTFNELRNRRNFQQPLLSRRITTTSDTRSMYKNLNQTDLNVIDEKDNSLENVRVLKQRIQVERNRSSTEERLFKQEIKTLRIKQQYMGQDYQDLLSNYKNKDRELNIIKLKNKQLQQLLKTQKPSGIVHQAQYQQQYLQQDSFRQSTPSKYLDTKYSNSSRKNNLTTTEVQEEEQKPYQNLTIQESRHLLQTPLNKPDQTITERKSVKQGNYQDCTDNFRDEEILDEESEFIIVKIIIWTDDELINGIQCFYKMRNNNKKQIIEGIAHVVDQKQNYRTEVIDLDNDYIKSVKCSLTAKGYIEKLKIKSSNNKEFEVGRQNDSQLEVNMVNFDIDYLEIPVCAFGGLKILRDQNNQEIGSILSYLGFDVAKDTFGTEKNNDQEQKISQRQIENIIEIDNSLLNQNQQENQKMQEDQLSNRSLLSNKENSKKVEQQYQKHSENCPLHQKIKESQQNNNINVTMNKSKQSQQQNLEINTLENTTNNNQNKNHEK